MKIEGTSTVAAPRERVFAMLLDPAVLQRAIPGCEEIAPLGDSPGSNQAGSKQAFRIRMSAGLASIRGKVEGEITVEESRAPEHYRLSMRGKGMGSFVEGFAAIDLVAAGDATQVSYAGEAKVGGMIAAVGNRMIDLAVRKALSDFFGRLQQEAAG
jgi:carbon monoxide dehydrogenase subunit G